MTESQENGTKPSRVIKKTVKYTGEEWAKIEEDMSRLNIKKYSKYLRTVLFNLKRPNQISDESRLIFELNKAGNNFNQLVKTFNTYSKSNQNSIWLNEKHKETVDTIVSIISNITKAK